MAPQGNRIDLTGKVGGKLVIDKSIMAQSFNCFAIVVGGVCLCEVVVFYFECMARNNKIILFFILPSVQHHFVHFRILQEQLVARCAKSTLRCNHATLNTTRLFSRYMEGQSQRKIPFVSSLINCLSPD